MTLEETEKKLKELLSQGASQEELLKKLKMAEGAG
jgi:DNA-binding CsgD family transcriptional regulator